MAARLDTLEAENIVLAALMANPGNWELLQPQEEWFTETFSLAVLDTVKKLMAAGRTVDLVTVGQALKSDGIPQALSRVAQVQGYSVFDAESAAKSLKEAAARRRVSRRALELVALAEDPLTQDGELWAAVEALAAMLQRQGEVDVSPVGKIVEELWQSIKSRKVLTGQQTGFIDLDRMIGGLRDGELVIIGARPGMGKALALDTPIPTTSGWKTMGDIEVGDLVFDEQGNPCKVTHTTPIQFNRKCYQIEFDDGSKIVADTDHLWLAYDLSAWKSMRERYYRKNIGYYSNNPNRNKNLVRDQSDRHKNPRVVTTQQMINEGIRKNDRPNWYLQLAKPLKLPEEHLPVDPYILGCWLGDGSTNNSQITVGHEDFEHFKTEFAKADYPLERDRELQCRTVPVCGKGAWQGYKGTKHLLTRELQQVGLLGGSTKHIPSIYLRASLSQRLAILQGLMDTDGCVTNKNGTVEICQKNQNLLKQTREIVCSLGHKPGQIRKKTIPLENGRVAIVWQFNWTPLESVFRLKRKADRLDIQKSHRAFGRMTRRAVISITSVESVPVRCIAVDSPNHIYLAGDSMIPTHNTAFGLELLRRTSQPDRPGIMFSLEMSRQNIAERLVTQATGLETRLLRAGTVPDWQLLRAETDVNPLYILPVYVTDKRQLKLHEIKAVCLKQQRQVGLGPVVVDYLTLMGESQARGENRTALVERLAVGLQAMAMDLKTPVVVVSQLNRAVEMREDKRPTMADLRDSGGIEQAAHLVMLLYRPGYYYPKEEKYRNILEVIVAKQKDGPTGTVPLYFDLAKMHFADLARHREA